MKRYAFSVQSVGNRMQHLFFLCQTDEKGQFSMAIIILVDDDPDILDPLKEMLEGENFRVKAFLHPQTAL